MPLFGFAVAGAPVAGAVVAAPGSGVVVGSVAGSVGVCVAGACVVEGATVTVAGLPAELSVSVPLPPPQEASSSVAVSAAAPVVSSPAARRLPLFLFRLIV